MNVRKVLPAAGGVAAAAALLVLAAGCESRSYDVRYELSVTEAVVEENVPDDGPATDEIAVRATWSATGSALSARFSNPADTTAAILWEGATYTPGAGEPVALVTTAPSPGDELPQAPTVVPARGEMAVDMLPLPDAEWEWLPNRVMGGFWKASPALFGVDVNAAQSDAERRSLAESVVGERFVIKIPMRTGKRVMTHIYDVRVAGAEVFPSYH